MTRQLAPSPWRREQTQRLALFKSEIRFMSERRHPAHSVIPEDKATLLDGLQD